MTIGMKTAFRAPTALRVVWPAMILVLIFFSFAGAANEFLQPTNVSCACPNQVLTFQCTVDGGGSTLWTGSAFSCDNNQIILLHFRFTSGTNGECNDGAIVAESLNGENDRYSSQLRANVSSGLNNRTVRCLLNTITGDTIPVSEAQIVVVTAPIDQVPTGIRLTNVKPGQLTFTWNAVNTNCPSINYIPNSNCTAWSCDNPTNTTTTVCSGLQLPSVCTFTVQTEVCGQVGLPSEPVRVTLRVPNMPMVKIIPVYSGAQQGLLRIKANITDGQDSFNITNTVSGSVTSYNISFNFGDPMMFGRNTSCVEDICEYVIDVPSDLCQSSNDVSVALSASNRVGQGPSSDRTTIGCTNQFVEVEYDRMTSSITCRFLDETDTSIKSCSVTYGQCGQVPGQPVRLGNFSTMEAPNTVYIKLPVDGDKLECYSVTASSDLFTVIVETNNLENGNGGASVAVIVGIIIALLVVAVAVISIIILILVFVTYKKRGNKINEGVSEGHRLVGTNKSEQVEDDKGNTGSSHFQEEAGKGQCVQTKAEKACNTVKVKFFEDKANSVIDVDDLPVTKTLNNGSYKIIKVTTESELREFLEAQNLSFKRGYAFYEVLHDFESISKNKKLIFSDKEHGLSTLYEVEISPEHPLCGFRLPKPTGDGALFVQSTGSGARYLPAQSKLLYKIEPQTLTSSKPDPLLLKPVLSNHFELTTLLSELTVKQFFEEKQIPKEYSVFLEFGDCDKKDNYVDVMLQDKDTGFLFTGPGAHNMVNKHSDGEKLDFDNWRVFVLCYKLEENMVLKRGTTILHQALGFNTISTDDFHVLTQDKSEDYTCMSDFIKSKLSPTEYTNGHAFYEFKREEDLHCYKDVVHLCEEDNNVVVHSGIDLFYRLPGVLGMGVNPQPKKGVRVFIQSTSQGARCVKPGDTILYKKTV